VAYQYQILNDRAGSRYAEVTGYEGEIRTLAVPEQIEGVPVRRIGANAFSGRDDLTRVLLPETIDTLGRYAFYNCKNLTSLKLHDGVGDYYDGVIKQCRSLREITLIQNKGSYSVMKELLADNDRCLHFIVEPAGLHLTFPAYVYDFVEDVEARVLHHKIEGSGYPYRECVTRKGVDLLSYDRLFSQAYTDDYRAAIDIAPDRLMYPLELETAARERYEQYLEQTGSTVAAELIGADRLDALRYLTGACLIRREVLDEAIPLAAQENKSAITALLMEYQREHFAGRASAKALTLEDW
jgi:hypothetical protein